MDLLLFLKRTSQPRLLVRHHVDLYLPNTSIIYMIYVDLEVVTINYTVLSCYQVVTQLIMYVEHPNVVSVFLDQGRNLHTTHSWDFLLLVRDGVIRADSLWKKARFGEDVIIANLDTGTYYICLLTSLY